MIVAVYDRLRCQNVAGTIDGIQTRELKARPSKIQLNRNNSEAFDSLCDPEMANSFVRTRQTSNNTVSQVQTLLSFRLAVNANMSKGLNRDDGKRANSLALPDLTPEKKRAEFSATGPFCPINQ